MQCPWIQRKIPLQSGRRRQRRIRDPRLGRGRRSKEERNSEQKRREKETTGETEQEIQPTEEERKLGNFKKSGEESIFRVACSTGSIDICLLILIVNISAWIRQL